MSRLTNRNRCSPLVVLTQVYILGRMGNARQALHLIIEKLGDIPQAIDFVRSQRDEELWDYLITWALGSSETTGLRPGAPRVPRSQWDLCLTSFSKNLSHSLPPKAL